MCVFLYICAASAPYRKRGRTSLNVNDDTSMTRYITQRLMSYDNRKRGRTSLNVNDDTSMTRYITQRLMSYDNRKRGRTSPSVNDETSIQDQYPEHLRVLIEDQRHIQ